MATSVGQINFGVGIDASGIAAQINASLTPALATVQQKLNQNPLKVKIDIDTATAIAEARTALGKANLKIDVKVDVKFTAAQQAAIQEIRNLSDKTITVKFNINLSADDIKKLRQAATAIRQLDDKSVTVNFAINLTDSQLKNLRQAATAIRRLESKDITVNFNITGISDDQLKNLRGAASAIRRLDSKSITVRIDIDADEARLRALAEVLRNLRDRNLRVGVNADKGPVDRLLASLGSLAKFTGIGAGITAGLAAIVGAAGAAAGAVGGLVLSLAAVGPALAAIGATAVVGFQGIGDAFSALGDISANAASDARTQAEAVASAEDAMASAADSAAAAQESLADAQDNAADAAKDVADAYKTAQERLDNYQTTLKEASLDEKEAALDLKEAREALNKGGFKSQDDYQRALLKVERAEINLTKAQKANKDLNDQAAEDLAKGVEQSDEVVAAKKKQADADQAVVAAQRNVAAANRAVASAAENLAKAQSGAGTSSEKFADALARLSPNAQAFVLAAKEIQPELENVRKGVQDALFAGLGDQLKQTAEVVLPLMKTGMQGIATELNGVATNMFEFLRSEEGVRLLNAQFEGGINLLKGLRQGTGEFKTGLVDLAETAAPRLEGIGREFALIGSKFGAGISEIAKSGVLDQVLVGFEGTLGGLGDLVNDLVVSFGQLGAEVLPALGPLFSTLGEAIRTIAPSLGEIGKIFTNSLTAILPSLAELIKALAEGLQPVLPVLVGLIQTLATAIQPLIEPFSQIAVIVGQTLINTVNALAPALEPLATAFASLLNAISPILPLIATLVANFVEALAPALTTIFDALAPVIQSLVDQLTPVFNELAPILAEVAQTIATALVQAIDQLAPLLPDLVQAWADLILAIAPFIPQIIQIAVDLLPPLISIIEDLLPVLTLFIEAFTWIVEHVLPLVIQALSDMSDQWRDTFDTIADVVHWFTDTVPNAISDAIDTVKNAFSTGVDWIGTKFDELKGKAATPINFVIETVFNNGLLKAWGSIDNLLGGVLPDITPIPKITGYATGGGISGKGTGTSDDILAWLSNGEHVVTAAEVVKAGGQDVLYTIRDMIFRGIPFSWDNGRVIAELGQSNMAAYGAKVKVAGYGNVPPEGLFDPLARVPIPQFATGGQATLMPWMLQLQKGHEFAKAQNGKPYQWAGPRFVNDSFDCSGFMASIAAAILGDDPWRRYWATASFAGYPTVGPQGFTKGLKEGSGFGIGVTDDPGGPGGGHTAGALAGIPLLNIPEARVESGGSLGDVHYGRGTDPNTFASFYGLPIGANGFFQPSPGGTSNGPSTAEQSSFITKTIEKILKAATDPVRELIKTTMVPPPQTRNIPLAVLDGTNHYFAETAGKAVTNLGGLLGGVWQRAKDLGGGVLDAGRSILDSLNPFDTGGIANGTGILTKNTIEPERVLSPEQTALFEQLVQALVKIANSGISAAGQAAETVTVDLSESTIDALRTSTGVDARTVAQTAIDTEFFELTEQITASQNETAELISSTAEESLRTQTNFDVAAQAVADEQTKQLLEIADKLSSDVLGPIMSAAVSAGTDFITNLIDGVGTDIVKAVNGTTSAVKDVTEAVESSGDSSTASFGSPGSSFDAVSEISTAIQTVASAATSAFNAVRDDIVAAALKQKRSEAGESRGLLGKDIDAGFLGNLIVELTGVEIEVRDTLENTYDAIQSFREGAFSGFDQTGELISDTSALIQRNQSSIELAAAEQERIQKALIKAVIKYLIVNVLIPIITAILGAMITLATTAIGAAIGSAIPIIGTAIGAAVGAAVGAALSGLAAVFTSLLAVGAGAAIDAFDEGGIAPGIGYMPKNTIAPERVLSPRQTTAFETLVGILDGKGGNRSVNVASMNVYGTGAADKSADRLLSLLNT